MSVILPPPRFVTRVEVGSLMAMISAYRSVDSAPWSLWQGPSPIGKVQAMYATPPHKMTTIFQTKTFNCNLVNEKIDTFIIEVCSLWCNWREITIGLDNGLVSNRWQAII